MAKIHFISGLPRSGSTLLAALLRQNPRFQAGMSGPLAGLFGALLGQMSARNEYSVFIDDAQRERIVHGLFDSFYADSPAEVIFDTSRAWCGSMPAISRLCPEAKVIACVREMPWVLDSIERLVQRETLTADPGATLRVIYDFLGEPVFEHDFGHVDYDVTEFDERAGTPGLHTVRGTVHAEPRETLLPPDLFKRFIHDAFWRDPSRIPAGLRIV